VLETARVRFLSPLCKTACGAARRPFSLAHPHVQRVTGKMAKSTNHTAHNQSYKNHRNGACCPRPGAPRGVDPGEARCFHAIAKHSRRETFQPRAPDDRRCLRLLRRERPRIRGEVSGIGMARLIASRRRAAWLASPAEPAASSRASAFRGRRVLLFRGRTHFSTPRGLLVRDRDADLFPLHSPRFGVDRHQEAQEGAQKVAEGYGSQVPAQPALLQEAPGDRQVRGGPRPHRAGVIGSGLVGVWASRRKESREEAPR